MDHAHDLLLFCAHLCEVDIIDDLGDQALKVRVNAPAAHRWAHRAVQQGRRLWRFAIHGEPPKDGAPRHTKLSGDTRDMLSHIVGLENRDDG